MHLFPENMSKELVQLANRAKQIYDCDCDCDHDQIEFSDEKIRKEN